MLVRAPPSSQKSALMSTAILLGAFLIGVVAWRRLNPHPRKPGDRAHLRHVRLGVRLRHDYDSGREFHVAAHVIAVRVRVDDRGDGLARQLLDIAQRARRRGA